MINKYPYTDFNEYNMDWIIKTVKDLSDAWAETKTEWGDMQTEWTNYKNYIDNYFENLDVSQEISDKIDAMIEDGTFSTIIAPFFEEAIAEVPTLVSEWIAANLLQETGYVIDKSLSTENAAADAFYTGLVRDNLYNADMMEDVELHPVYVEGHGLSSSGAITSNSKRMATDEFIDIRFAKWYLKTTVASGYRHYVCFYDSAQTFISSPGWKSADDNFTIPSTAAYMRIQASTVSESVPITLAEASNFSFKAGTVMKVFYENANTFKHPLTDAAYNDLDAIFECGAYPILYNTAASNLPAGFIADNGGGMLFVLPFGSMYSTLYHKVRVMQVLYDEINNKIYHRHATVNNSGWTTSWTLLDLNKNMGDIVTQTKWLAIGDSITYGVYSDGGGSHDWHNHGWPNMLASACNYSILNKGVRGMGYIAVGSNSVTLNDVLDDVETLTPSDYNLVTISLGINDYNTSSITLAQLRPVIENCLQRVCTHFQEAQIVVITPFNASRRGTSATKFSCDYAYGGRSLRDIAELIEDCCYNAGVRCINATEDWLLNIYNIETMLPDDVHPSQECHELIAKTMLHELIY